jgi:hypothetical protein
MSIDNLHKKTNEILCNITLDRKAELSVCSRSAQSIKQPNIPNKYNRGVVYGKIKIKKMKMTLLTTKNSPNPFLNL